jgi:hypothetical protein
LTFHCLRIGQRCHCQPAEGQDDRWQAQHNRVPAAEVTEGEGDNGRDPSADAYTGKPPCSPCRPPVATVLTGTLRRFGGHGYPLQDIERRIERAVVRGNVQ